MDQADPNAALLLYALQNFPETVGVVNLERVIVDSSRMNDKRPAQITLAAPDDVVKSIRGRVQSRDTVLVIRIPASVRQRSESLIILPGQDLVRA